MSSSTLRLTEVIQDLSSVGNSLPFPIPEWRKLNAGGMILPEVCACLFDGSSPSSGAICRGGEMVNAIDLLWNLSCVDHVM